MIATLHDLHYSGVGKGKVATNERKEKATTEGQEIRASHEEVEGFVARLREFHGSLGEGEQAMLEVVLEGAVAGETGGYRKMRRYEDASEGSAEQESSSGWNDLVGWIEEQGEEDTQGFVVRKS